MQNIDHIVKIAIEALEDVKGKQITELNTAELTSEFQRLIVATGDSNRQVKALANNVRERSRKPAATSLASKANRPANGYWSIAAT